MLVVPGPHDRQSSSSSPSFLSGTCWGPGAGLGVVLGGGAGTGSFRHDGSSMRPSPVTRITAIAPTIRPAMTAAKKMMNPSTMPIVPASPAIFGACSAAVWNSFLPASTTCSGRGRRNGVPDRRAERAGRRGAGRRTEAEECGDWGEGRVTGPGADAPSPSWDVDATWVIRPTSLAGALRRPSTAASNGFRPASRLERAPAMPVVALLGPRVDLAGRVAPDASQAAERRGDEARPATVIAETTAPTALVTDDTTWSAGAMPRAAWSVSAASSSPRSCARGAAAARRAPPAGIRPRPATPPARGPRGRGRAPGQPRSRSRPQPGRAHARRRAAACASQPFTARRAAAIMEASVLLAADTMPCRRDTARVTTDLAAPATWPATSSHFSRARPKRAPKRRRAAGRRSRRGPRRRRRATARPSR